MALRTRITDVNIIDEWGGCDEWCLDETKKALIRQRGAGVGQDTVDEMKNSSANLQERCWEVCRMEMLEEKFWDLWKFFLNTVPGAAHPDTLAVLDNAKLDIYPARRQLRDKMQAIKADVPRGEKLTSHMASLIPYRALVSIFEHKERGRTKRQRTIRRASAFLGTLNVYANPRDNDPNNPKYQAVLFLKVFQSAPPP